MTEHQEIKFTLRENIEDYLIELRRNVNQFYRDTRYYVRMAINRMFGKTYHVKFSDFLRTGRFGCIQNEMFPSQIVELLGEPDYIHTYFDTETWIYGRIEIVFIRRGESKNILYFKLPFKFYDFRLPIRVRMIGFFPSHSHKTSIQLFETFLARKGIPYESQLKHLLDETWVEIYTFGTKSTFIQDDNRPDEYWLDAIYTRKS